MELDLRVEFEQGPPRSLIRRANVLVSSFGALTVVDFSVVHALQPSIALADVQPGKAARQIEHLKMRERAAICSRVGRSFVPFAAGAAGTLGGKARIYCRT